MWCESATCEPEARFIAGFMYRVVARSAVRHHQYCHPPFAPMPTRPTGAAMSGE
ncbi:hypothetical protein FTUN_5929 [Frigoriglobus tundricola]|uniref:Uncharacterized protein n=1 Tax=Frigoriglobus tundricola TaxID=2774151 RepID=A0A6M5YYL4_9BACT|nr:hypothetical protein FTUN_5929 [Frigoriglobus tundricola]